MLCQKVLRIPGPLFKPSRPAVPFGMLIEQIMFIRRKRICVSFDSEERREACGPQPEGQAPAT